ncbi:LGFP repeat-containing protein [Actinoplanes sp. CA-142083]|uniref:LGFP repeat-containing protein n=1 Tax=Actinoplanes sp. CA-142083 TaxID=3239903 RepID=UPI003D8E6B16
MNRTWRAAGIAVLTTVATAGALATATPASADSTDVTQAWNPGPPACLTTDYVHANLKTGKTEVQHYVGELRFGDHVYRRYVRFTTTRVQDPSPPGFPRNWMNTCGGQPTQQVLALGKYTTAYIVNGDYAEFANATVAKKSGDPNWHEIRGSINAKYHSNGGFFEFGFPLTSESPTPKKVGAFNHFERNNSSIYWSPSTGAHQTSGVIKDKWASLGWENSADGFPTSDVFYLGTGRYGEHFQNGSIYYSGATGVHEIHGAIRDAWARMGWQNSVIGMPTSEEFSAGGGKGRGQHFANGDIYWSAATGAHEVHGSIRDKYASFGWENGFLRFPTSDEYSAGGGIGRGAHFQGGDIYWTPRTGAHEVHGEIRAAWAKWGFENKSVGFPTSDEYADPSVAGGRQQDFMPIATITNTSSPTYVLAKIKWSPRKGATLYLNTVPRF